MTSEAAVTASQRTGAESGLPRAWGCIQSAQAAKSNASAVAGFTGVRPGNPVRSSSMSKCHPRSTARPTTAIKQLDARLNASSDDTSRWLRPAPPDGGVGAWLLTFMCRAEPQPGGAAATIERGREHERAEKAWSG